MRPYRDRDHRFTSGASTRASASTTVLYTVVQALARAGMIAATETEREGRRPERTVPTRCSMPGGVELIDWLSEMLEHAGEGVHPVRGRALAVAVPAARRRARAAGRPRAGDGRHARPGAARSSTQPHRGYRACSWSSPSTASPCARPSWHSPSGSLPIFGSTGSRASASRGYHQPTPARRSCSPKRAVKEIPMATTTETRTRSRRASSRRPTARRSAPSTGSRSRPRQAPLRPARPERRRQVDDDQVPHDADAARPRRGARRRHRRARGPGAVRCRSASSVRAELRPRGDRPREPRAPGQIYDVAGARLSSASMRCSSASTSRGPPTARVKAYSAACSAGSTSPRARCTARGALPRRAHDGPRPGGARRMWEEIGASPPRSSRRSCSRPTTSRRPTSSPPSSRSSTVAASSPRARPRS